MNGIPMSGLGMIAGLSASSPLVMRLTVSVMFQAKSGYPDKYVRAKQFPGLVSPPESTMNKLWINAVQKPLWSIPVGTATGSLIGTFSSVFWNGFNEPLVVAVDSALCTAFSLSTSLTGAACLALMNRINKTPKLTLSVQETLMMIASYGAAFSTGVGISQLTQYLFQATNI